MQNRSIPPNITSVLWTLAAVLGAIRAEGGELVLADQGRARATIIVAADTHPKVKAAAEELQTYIEKITGVKLPVATDAGDPSGPLVLVGRSRLSEAMGVEMPAGLTPSRRDEGFVIACRGDRLLLAGNNDGPYHGTEYAVYEFLRSLGVRWFMPGEFGEVVPRIATLRIPQQETRQKPDFVMRNWWLHAKPELAAEEARWKLRNKMNPDAMFATPGDSSVRNICPPKAMVQEKPELFAMNEDGTRNPFLPNLSNPESVRYAADVIKKYFREHPEANSYGFAPDDGMPRDFNPATVQRNQGFVELGGRPGVPGEVSTSEEWLTFVNDVTREVRKEFPHVYIATNGYANRDIPPQGVELDDHLVIMFAAIWSCTLHGYDDPRCWHKDRQGQMLRRWCAMGPNTWIYGYNYNMLVSGLTPLPEFSKLRRDFPLMKKWGVMGFYDETRNVWAEPGIAGKYLRAQLEWNAQADVDSILDDFFVKWYEKAAAPAKAFWFALDEAVAAAPIHGHEDRVMPEVYSPKLLETLQQHVAEAERLADTPRAKLHVRADSLIFDHLRAYVAMAVSEAAGDFAAAARQADRMLALRKDLHQINPHFIWPAEDGYHAGVWYWTITDRKKYYESLAAKVSGPAGELVAMLPQEAAFRTDPHDEGVFAGWYEPSFDDSGWKGLASTRPFYRQGHDDPQGHGYLGHIWYRFQVDVPADARGKKVMLSIPVVTTEAWCWVNGRYIGRRPYLEAYIRPAPMEVDVTEAIRPGERNVVAVRVYTSLSAAQAAEGICSRAFLYAPK
ncbi:MAG: DUF4838 domain-containing protein [Pirellulales bacterium]|nr:DUF4838 domain-containing protein [Pirellulales bacterium]